MGHAIGVAHCHEKNETLDLNSHYRSQINIDKVCVVAVDDFIRNRNDRDVRNQVKGPVEQNRKQRSNVVYQERMREAFGKNVYGFLEKPIQKELLFACLNKIIAERKRC